MAWIDDEQPADGRKPQPPVSRACDDRLYAGPAFDRALGVERTVGCADDPLLSSRGELLQVVPLDREDSLAARHPEAPIVVFRNAVDHVVEQPVGLGEAEDVSLVYEPQ